MKERIGRRKISSIAKGNMKCRNKSDITVITVNVNVTHWITKQYTKCKNEATKVKQHTHIEIKRVRVESLKIC